jgi:hypothetical protein
MNDNDSLNLDNVELQAEEKLKVKNRFDKLSEKVILTGKERDEALAKAKTEAERAEAASKEASFYKDFSVNISKYPAASEYQDKILEKVRSGYSTEDAMVSVLAKEGKLSSQPAQQPSVQVEGGSALTLQGGSKSLRDMSADEKFAALTEADKTGDLVQALRG